MTDLSICLDYVRCCHLAATVPASVGQAKMKLVLETASAPSSSSLSSKEVSYLLCFMHIDIVCMVAVVYNDFQYRLIPVLP
jgi:hypothetical protein